MRAEFGLNRALAKFFNIRKVQISESGPEQEKLVM